MTAPAGPPSRYQRPFWRAIRHYAPAWATIFMVVIPLLTPKVEQAAPAFSAQLPPTALPPRWLADINLGMLSFWLWAILTNAHDGRLVCSSGRRAAADEEERRTEFVAIVFGAFLTVIFYLACTHAIASWLAFALTAGAVGAPLIILGSPE